MGVLSSLGNEIDSFFNNIKNGKSGISPIESFDTSNHSVKIAGEVKINLEDFFPKKDLNRIDRFSAFALIAAEEAIKILDDMRRLEDAGAFGAEVECVADDALEEIKKHTSLVINSLGSGSSGDVIFLFFEDICGETGNPPGKMPKHAKSWGDGKAIREKLDQERRNAIKGFKEDVVAGNFPSEDYTVSMLPGEKDKLIEELDKI